MHVYACIIGTTKYIQREQKQKSPLGGQVSGYMYLCANFQGVSLRQKHRGHHFLLRETCVFYVVDCDYLVLV